MRDTIQYYISCESGPKFQSKTKLHFRVHRENILARYYTFTSVSDCKSVVAGSGKSLHSHSLLQFV